MSKPDGGPAFPNAVDCAVSADRKDVQYVNGMSLRDYFAGQALAGWTASNAIARIAQAGGMDLAAAHETLAESCYVLADAMIKARAK